MAAPSHALSYGYGIHRAEAAAEMETIWYRRALKIVYIGLIMYSRRVVSYTHVHMQMDICVHIISNSVIYFSQNVFWILKAQLKQYFCPIQNDTQHNVYVPARSMHLSSQAASPANQPNLPSHSISFAFSYSCIQPMIQSSAHIHICMRNWIVLVSFHLLCIFGWLAFGSRFLARLWLAHTPAERCTSVWHEFWFWCFRWCTGRENGVRNNDMHSMHSKIYSLFLSCWVIYIHTWYHSSSASAYRTLVLARIQIRCDSAWCRNTYTSMNENDGGATGGWGRAGHLEKRRII